MEKNEELHLVIQSLRLSMKHKTHVLLKDIHLKYCAYCMLQVFGLQTDFQISEEKKNTLKNSLNIFYDPNKVYLINNCRYLKFDWKRLEEMKLKKDNSKISCIGGKLRLTTFVIHPGTYKTLKSSFRIIYPFRGTVNNHIRQSNSNFYPIMKRKLIHPSKIIQDNKRTYIF